MIFQGDSKLTFFCFLRRTEGLTVDCTAAVTTKRQQVRKAKGSVKLDINNVPQKTMTLLQYRE